MLVVSQESYKSLLCHWHVNVWKDDSKLKSLSTMTYTQWVTLSLIGLVLCTYGTCGTCGTFKCRTPELQKHVLHVLHFYSTTVRPSYLIFARRGNFRGTSHSYLKRTPHLAKDMIENEHLLIMNTTHSCSQVGRFEYACRTCGHKLGAKRALRQHMRTVHPSLLKVFFQNKRNISCLLQEN